MESEIYNIYHCSLLSLMNLEFAEWSESNLTDVTAAVSF